MKSRLLLTVAVLAFASVSCKGKTLIDHVAVTPSDNLESIRVSLVFSQTVQSTLSGGFPIADYGFLFLKPFVINAQPFEIGFDLSTQVLSDVGLAQLEPTEVLPNGVPIGLGTAMVQVQGATPINAHYDLYGYVDVLHGQWLGAAAVFDFINDTNFPDGLTISQLFLRDELGNAAIQGNIFGPVINGNGQLVRPGGLAVFANVQHLLKQARLGKSKSKTKKYRSLDVNVVHSSASTSELRRMEKQLKVNLNQSRY